jgi:predicted metal-dependent RNase
MTDKEKEILRTIGKVILKHNNDNYNETYKHLDMMFITNIQFMEYQNVVIIDIGRPGILIGKQGALIKEIEKAIGIETRLTENKIKDYLYPCDLEDYL